MKRKREVAYETNRKINFNTYFIMRNQTENKNTNINENNSEPDNINPDSIKLTNTSIANNDIIENYDIIINGKQKKLTATFSWIDYAGADYDNHAYTLKGKFNDQEFLDLNFSDEVNLFNIHNIKNLLNTSNFQFLKGSDNKNYLLIAFNISSDLNSSFGNLYIFNDDLKLIDEMIIKDNHVGWELENNTYPYYEDNLGMCDNFDLYNNMCNIKVKIANNQIYYLQDQINSDTNTSIGYVEERVYTINNNKLSYEVINTYKISKSIYGQY